MRRVPGPILMVFAAATTAIAEPQPIAFELKDAEFNSSKQAFKDLKEVDCSSDLPKFGADCPIGYDCSKKAGPFQVATTGLGVGASGFRYFSVIPTDRPSEVSCWRARLMEAPGTSGEAALGSAKFTVRQGSVHADGEITIFVQGNSALEDLSKDKVCPGWTLGVGSTGACTLSPVWQHPQYSGKILGCSWSDRSKILTEVTACSSASDQAAIDVIRQNRSGQTVSRKTAGKGIGLNLESRIPWSKWMETFQAPFDPPPDRSVDVTVYYRFSDGGPVQDQTFAVAYQIASPWYLLLGCLLFGSVIGSALPPLAEFARKKPVKRDLWVRTAMVLSVYGVVLWGVLYLLKGRVGLLQTELRLDQAFPVMLFGLLIGFRGLKYVFDWLDKLLVRDADRGTGAAAAQVLAAIVLATVNLQAARPPSAAPRQLVAIAGQVLLVNDEGIYRLDDGAGEAKTSMQQQQQQDAYRAPSDLTQLVRFVPGAIAGGAAAGSVQMEKGEPRELLFVSLVLPGGRAVIDQYSPDGTQSGNRLLELRRAGSDFAGTAPVALAWDRGAQRLYVASPSGAIWAYPFGGEPQRLVTARASFSALALDEPGRRLFAADVGNGRVLMMDLSQPAAGLTAFADDSPLESPWALLYDEASKALYVADEHRDTVFILKVPPRPQRPLKTKWSPWIGKTYAFLKTNGFGDPVAIAIAGGRLWIADREARKVFPVDMISRKQFTPLSLK